MIPFSKFFIFHACHFVVILTGFQLFDVVYIISFLQDLIYTAILTIILYLFNAMDHAAIRSQITIYSNIIIFCHLTLVFLFMVRKRQELNLGTL
jgi:hypothetical protein